MGRRDGKPGIAYSLVGGGRWSGSRVVRRQMKDLALSETGFQYGLWNSILASTRVVVLSAQKGGS